MTRRALTALLALTMTVAWLAPTAHAKQRDGRGGDTRVIGGQQSAPGQWPWQVALLSAHTSNSYAAFFCGGTVISRSWILTAAHCVVEADGTPTPPSNINVLIGTNVLGDGSGRRATIAAVRPNPRWDSISNQNDEALLRLSKPTNATPIPLVTASQRSLWAAGVEATVSGWGNTSSDPAQASYPTHLRHARGPDPVGRDLRCEVSGEPRIRPHLLRLEHVVCRPARRRT